MGDIGVDWELPGLQLGWPSPQWVSNLPWKQKVQGKTVCDVALRS